MTNLQWYYVKTQIQLHLCYVLSLLILALNSCPGFSWCRFHFPPSSCWFLDLLQEEF